MTPIYAEKGAQAASLGTAGVPPARMPGEKLAAETAALPLFRQLENLSRLAIFWMRFAQLICANLRNLRIPQNETRPRLNRMQNGL